MEAVPAPATKICIDCEESKGGDGFSENQYNKRSGEGQCIKCSKDEIKKAMTIVMRKMLTSSDEFQRKVNEHRLLRAKLANPYANHITREHRAEVQRALVPLETFMKYCATFDYGIEGIDAELALLVELITNHDDPTYRKSLNGFKEAIFQMQKEYEAQELGWEKNIILQMILKNSDFLRIMVMTKVPQLKISEGTFENVSPKKSTKPGKAETHRDAGKKNNDNGIDEKHKLALREKEQEMLAALAKMKHENEVNQQNALQEKDEAMLAALATMKHENEVNQKNALHEKDEAMLATLATMQHENEVNQKNAADDNQQNLNNQKKEHQEQMQRLQAENQEQNEGRLGDAQSKDEELRTLQADMKKMKTEYKEKEKQKKETETILKNEIEAINNEYQDELQREVAQEKERMKIEFEKQERLKKEARVKKEKQQKKDDDKKIRKEQDDLKKRNKKEATELKEKNRKEANKLKEKNKIQAAELKAKSKEQAKQTRKLKDLEKQLKDLLQPGDETKSSAAGTGQAMQAIEKMYKQLKDLLEPSPGGETKSNGDAADTSRAMQLIEDMHEQKELQAALGDDPDRAKTYVQVSKDVLLNQHFRNSAVAEKEHDEQEEQEEEHSKMKIVASLVLFVEETRYVLLYCFKQEAKRHGECKKIASELQTKLEGTDMQGFLKFLNDNNKNMGKLSEQTNYTKFITQCRTGGGRFCHLMLPKYLKIVAIVNMCKKIRVKTNDGTTEMFFGHVRTATGSNTTTGSKIEWYLNEDEEKLPTLLQHLFDFMKNNTNNKTVAIEFQELLYVSHGPAFTPLLTKKNESFEGQARDQLWEEETPVHPSGKNTWTKNKRTEAFNIGIAFLSLHFKLFRLVDRNNDDTVLRNKNFFKLGVAQQKIEMNTWFNAEEMNRWK